MNTRPQRKTDHLRPKASDVGQARRAPAEALAVREISARKMGGMDEVQNGEEAYTGCEHGCYDSLWLESQIKLSQQL